MWGGHRDPQAMMQTLWVIWSSFEHYGDDISKSKNVAGMFGISQYGNLSIIHKPSPSNDSHRNVMKCDLNSDFCPFYEERKNDMFYARMSRPYARDLSETAQYKNGSLEET